MSENYFIEIYYDHLFRFCRSLSHSDEEAEEIFQETMLRATINNSLLMTLKKYQVKSWLFRVAKNYYIDRLRKTEREEEYDESNEMVDIELERFSSFEFESLIACLSKKNKSVLKYKYYFGYNSKEIAKILKIPMGTVRSRLHLALNKIKNNLEEKNEY